MTATRLLQDMLSEARAAALEVSRAEAASAKTLANEAWQREEYGECVRQLGVAIGHVPRDDVLHRYRSLAQRRLGNSKEALADAGTAVSVNPLGPRNFLCHAHMLQQQHLLQEAGAAYLSAMNLGSHGHDTVASYGGLLSTVRRERSYYNAMRPAHRKVLGGSHT